MATTVFFTSGTSLTIPSDYNNANNNWEAIGGGAGASYGSGAGAGEYRKIASASYTASATRTIQIGAGGTGATTNGNAGGSGTFTQLLADNNSTVALKAFGATGPTYGATAGTAGGTGGTGAGGNANGGKGGNSTTGFAGGGGGGAAGPSGAGGAGGANTAGGASGGSGGGGSNGGSAGGSASSTATAGGNGLGGTGGGAGGSNTGAGTAGSAGTAGTGAGGGGGGAGTALQAGGNGATGNIWTQTSNSATAGPGGGGGGAGGSGSIAHGTSKGGDGGLYGGGGGAQGNFSTGTVVGGNGAQGILVLTYTPAGGGSPYSMPAATGAVTLTGVANILVGPAALIQKNGGTVSGNTSIVTSLPQGTTAGTTILIFVSANGTVTTPSGFTSRSPQVAGLGTYLFEKLSSSGNSSDTPTLTQSAAYDAVWQIAEYKGITAYDTSSTNFSGSAAAGYWSTPSITPASGSKRLFGFVNAVQSTGTSGFFAAGDPQSWSNGFTGQRSDQIIGAGTLGHAPEAGGFADLVVAANGSTSYSTSAYINSSATGNTYAFQSIIAAYTTTNAPTPLLSPLFRSIAAVDYGGRTNTVVPAPAGIVNGDILILVYTAGAAGGPSFPTLPSGFTQIDHTSYTTGGFTVDQYVAWKRASSESGSYTITHPTVNSNAFIACYSNCIASGSPIDVYSKNPATVPTEGSNARALSVTTTVANTLALYIDHDWEKRLGRSPPSPFKEHYEDLSYIADNPQPSAGATGDVVAVNSNASPTSGWAAWLVALKPAVSASGSPYTMPAATGTVTLAGTTTGLRAARRLTATTGAIALAGTTTGLKCGRRLVAVQGSIALTGLATGLRAARRLTAVQGAITLTGFATGLIYSSFKTLTASTGAITLAGQAVALRVTRAMAAAKGSITLTGFDVVLTKTSGVTNKILAAAPGAITLSGQAAGLRVGRMLTAVKGTITLAGSATVLLKGKSPLLASTGAILVAGNPANLVYRASYRMAASYSSIRVAGPEGRLSRSGTEQPGTMEFGRTAYLGRW